MADTGNIITLVWNWLRDRTLIVAIVGCILLAGLSIYAQEVLLNRRCATLMGYAKTAPDSLAAAIACEKMRSDAATANAIALTGDNRYYGRQP